MRAAPRSFDPDAICIGCGPPMRDHLGPDGRLVGIPVDTPDVDPATCFAGQTERERLWDEHDRGFMSNAEYATALAELDERGEQ